MYFGFCNLHYYYKEFKIDIYNFITNSELLLSFFPTVVLITAFAYSYFIQEVVSKSQEVENRLPTNAEEKHDNFQSEETFWKRLVKSLSVYILFYYLIFFLIKYILIRCYHKKEFELQFFYLISAYLFCMMLYAYFMWTRKGNLITDNVLLFSVALVVYIGIEFSTYRRLDAIKVKNGISDRIVSFKTQDSHITTSKNLVFIGQTQSNLFLYNRNDSSTIIFKVSNIDSLIIK